VTYGNPPHHRLYTALVVSTGTALILTLEASRAQPPDWTSITSI
jgi:hypothetical protein